MSSLNEYFFIFNNSFKPLTSVFCFYNSHNALNYQTYNRNQQTVADKAAMDCGLEKPIAIRSLIFPSSGSDAEADCCSTGAEIIAKLLKLNVGR